MDIKLFILCALFCTVLGTGTYGTGGRFHPDHPNKCWDEQEKIAFGPGESFTKKCVKKVCTAVYPDEQGYSVEINDCSHPGSMSLPCKLSKPNDALDFPDCCGKWECP